MMARTHDLLHLRRACLPLSQMRLLSGIIQNTLMMYKISIFQEAKELLMLFFFVFNFINLNNNNLLYL
jgi:hypothetical protein